MRRQTPMHKLTNKQAARTLGDVGSGGPSRGFLLVLLLAGWTFGARVPDSQREIMHDTSCRGFQ